MTQRKKSAPNNATQSSAHPEKSENVKLGVPDADSSKTKTPAAKERDARSPHDRDGNEEQRRRPPNQ